MFSVAELISGCLRAAGVERVFGPIALPGLPHVPVADAALALLLADADGRLGSGPGVALVPAADGYTLRLSSRPGGPRHAPLPHLAHVTSVRDLPDAILQAIAPATFTIAACDVGIEMELDGPVPIDIEPLGAPRIPPSPEPPRLDAHRMMLLAGPDVARQGYGEALRTFAAAANVGVVSSWGAKGVVAWDSPLHLGAIGLQAREFELLDLRDLDLLLVTGLDPDESRPEQMVGAHLREVLPNELGPSATDVRRREEVITGALELEIASVVLPGFVDTATPTHPRAVADLRAMRADGAGIGVYGGADLAGFWLARAYPASAPDDVLVPATPAPGVAAALACCASLRGGRALAVVAPSDGTAELDDTTRRIIDLARTLECAFAVDVWSADAPAAASEGSVARLRDALHTPGVTVVRRGVALARTRDLVDVAGPIVAWGGLEVPS